MAVPPAGCAGTPGRGSVDGTDLSLVSPGGPVRVAGVDALSDLLRVLRFDAGVFLDARISMPWCYRSQVTPAECGPGLGPRAGISAFHYVLDGTIHVSVEGGPVHRAGPGDLILLPRNDVHLIGSDLHLPPSELTLDEVPDDGIAHVDLGGSADGERIVCGYLASASGPEPLLAGLPALLVVSSHGRPGAAWIESSFRYAAQEYAARRPGAQRIIAQLATLLFVEAIREHIAGLPADAVGWLAALRDPPLARALAAVHARIAAPWTTESLAREAFLSRSAFAERFARVLGQPPMAYLTGWRMRLAAQRLRESQVGIAQIAAEIGYESESTFSRAFRRAWGVAPGAWRRGTQAAAAEVATTG